MNRNIVYAEIFVDELARSGLAAVCAAPGSRHTPLMLAFAKHPDIRVYSHLDERSASFFALGLALASDSPVALICTSGTAGANMYPAIIEAHQSRVPLIVITADRPPELRHSGANQTIDQIKMFGDFVLWFVDAALPEANPLAVAIRNLRTTANRAYATANGLRKGVVHINMPFRKPLEPTPVEGDLVTNHKGLYGRKGNQPQSHVSVSISTGSDKVYTLVEDVIRRYRRGLIICGPRTPEHGRNYTEESIFWDLQKNLPSLSRVSGYPILADSLSGFRYCKLSNSQSYENLFGKNIPKPNFFGGYESSYSAIGKTLPPEVVIQFGDLPLSKSLNQYLSRLNLQYWIQISHSGQWSDDVHNSSHLIQVDEDILCYRMVANLATRNRLTANWYQSQINIEATTWQTIDHEMKNGAYFDGGVVYDIVDLMPSQSTLFAGNSLPVRLLDQFGKPQDKRIYTYANRGASGIDGNISTALGTGAARPYKPVVAVIGDITFYHDMNGLLAVHRCGVPITIVLLNNDGGGIFHRLPIKDYDPEFTEYFLTPHGLDFSYAAEMYGLEHVLIDVREPDARARFREAFSASVEARNSTIIEVKTDARADLRRRDEIVAAVHHAIGS